MATSPNYSWPEPDNTDLVKNGALAIRTLGNAIDTTMGTMTPKSTFTAKGSIAAASAASTPANLSVGSNGQTIVADSTASTGLKYSSNAPLGGMTAINVGGTALTGASTITISGFSNLSRISVLVDAASAGANSVISVRFNSDSGTQYGYSGLLTIGGTLGSAFSLSATSIPLAIQGNNDVNVVSGMLNLEGAFSAGMAQYNLGSKSSGGGAAFEAFNWSGFYLSSAQITSVSLISSTGNFDAGAIYVWGV
jgi:hypothetical protein